MPSKPGVLLVTTGPLLPLNAGGRIYTWGTTAPLAGDFDYHLICLATPEEAEEFTRDRNELMKRYNTVFKSFRIVPRPQIPGHMSRREALGHLWFHTRNGLPLMDVSYYSAEVVDAARDLVDSGQVQVLEVDHAQMAYVRRFVDNVPAILVNHNIEGDLHPFWMTDRWSIPELVVWRAFAAVSRHNTRQVEINNKYRFASKLFISDVDSDRVSDECAKVILPVPMRVGAPRSGGTQNRLSLLWLGSFDWPPNVEGLKWFVDRIWPTLAGDADNRYELHVIGSNPPENIKALHDGESVNVHGYVDDVSTLKKRADVLIAPILTGSGVRVKVLEGLAAGLPVVATSKGAEGLRVDSGAGVLLANTAGEFSDALRQLAASMQLRGSLSEAGQQYVGANHAPEAVASIKAAALRSALALGGNPVR